MDIRSVQKSQGRAALEECVLDTIQGQTNERFLKRSQR